MLIDKKIFTGGIAMLAVGIIIIINLNATMPIGHSGMSKEETVDLMTKQQENKNFNSIAGILIGIGFMLILISFGAKKKKGSSERIEKKHLT
jgi:hypothetical protein